jgi:hypothetical protein
MRVVRPIAISAAVATTGLLIAMAPPYAGFAKAAANANSFVIAQTSMGGPEPLPLPPPSLPPAPPPSLPPAPPPSLPTPSPRLDYIPPSLARPPAPGQPDNSSELPWGAIAFTADGSYSTTWKMPSQAEAEARVATKCAEYGRGGCKTVSFSGQQCVALATFSGRRWRLSYTAGGETYPEAQLAAMARCNSDERTRGRCQFSVATCADGR